MRRPFALIGSRGREPSGPVRTYASLTTCLPKFLPVSRPRKASGADSIPCATVSRYLSLPAAT